MVAVASTIISFVSSVIFSILPVVAIAELKLLDIVKFIFDGAIVSIIILSESRSDSVTECILPAKSEMIMANVALPSSPSIIDIFVITMLFDSMTFELRPSITEVALDRISFAINVTVIVSVVFAYDCTPK